MRRPTGLIARAIVLVGMVGAGILPASCDKKPLAERGPDGGGGVGGGGGSGGGGAGGQVVGGSGGQAVGGSGAGGAGGQAVGGAGGQAVGGAGGQAVGGAGGQAVGGAGGQARGGSGGQAVGGAGGSGATFVCPKLTSSPLRCQHGLQFCKLTSIGTSSCEPLPAACGSTPSCSCIPLTFPSCDFCMASGAGDIEVIFAADCLNPDGSR